MRKFFRFTRLSRLNLKTRKALFLGAGSSQRSEAWLDALLPSHGGSSARSESHLDRQALTLVAILITTLFLALSYQLASLQLLRHGRYAGLAEGNRLRRQISYAQRGRILDRNGKALVSNNASFQLVANPYLLSQDEAGREADYRQIAKALNRDSNKIKRAAEAKGLAYNQPLLIIENVNYIQALKLEIKLPELEGYSLDPVPIREYVSRWGLSNILGYVGRVDEQDLKRNPNLQPVDFIGQDGIEAQYDGLLRGQNGVIETEVDSVGRPLRTITEKKAQIGHDIQLTLDLGLQKVFADAIARQMRAAGSNRGAGVAIDPTSGEVLAMVSLPSYNNNLFSNGISSNQYQKLLNNPLQPLFNKAIAGGYPSGSIIKPLHLSGALQEKVVDEHTTIVDRGFISVPSIYDPSVVYTFKGWQPGGLGAMDARRAIAMSSDIYFYTVGGGYQGFAGMGVDRLAATYRKFGLGQNSGIDLPGETPGRVPTPEWKKQATGEDWFIGDTYNIAIGQGDLLVSPLQMAVGTSAIVNGGRILQPHIFKQALDASLIAKTIVKRDDFINPRYLQIVKEGMKQVIGGTTSTATFANVPVPVAGKSGTAETDPEARKKPHAWYEAFAPYDKPEIMFAVLLEGGEGGSQFAAPAIASAMQWYFTKGQ